MQKTPWFCEGQADVMLNYLPLRNVLTYGIKAMVKNKALRLCQTLQTPPSGHSLSPSPSQTWPYHGWSHVSSLSLSLTPFILRVSPGSCRGWTPANDGHPTERVQVVLEPAGHKEAAHTSIQAPPPAPCGASSPRQHLS